MKLINRVKRNSEYIYVRQYVHILIENIWLWYILLSSIYDSEYESGY